MYFNALSNPRIGSGGTGKFHINTYIDRIDTMSRNHSFDLEEQAPYMFLYPVTDCLDENTK